MSFYTKSKIQNFDNKPIKFKNSIGYPQPNNINLPKNFYTALSIGGTGSGKSFSVVKLLKYCEQYGYTNNTPQRIFLISPSIKSNPIYDTLKFLDESDKYHLEDGYDDFILQEILDDIKNVEIEIQKYNEDLKLYNKFKKIKSLNELNIDELLYLYKTNFEPPTEPRYKIPPVNHIILDDLINSNAFKQNGHSLINSLAVRNRHLGINLYIQAQSSNQIPKTIRLQARLLMVYRYNSKDIIKDLYDLVSSSITPEKFEKLYLDTTQKKYDFLCIDNTGNNLIFKQNFDYLISIP